MMGHRPGILRRGVGGPRQSAGLDRCRHMTARRNGNRISVERASAVALLLPRSVRPGSAEWQAADHVWNDVVYQATFDAMANARTKRKMIIWQDSIGAAARVELFEQQPVAAERRRLGGLLLCHQKPV